MIRLLSLVALLPVLLVGAAVPKASSYAGATSSDVFTATATGSDTTNFPAPSVVGFPGPTPSEYIA
jgi:hypothetical protein